VTASAAAPQIPKRFCFIWFGREFPLFAELAIRSALVQHPDGLAVLWHGPELSSEARERLQALPRTTLALVEEETLFHRLQDAVTDTLDVARLRDIWRELASPAARANLVRLIVLFLEGGVYLDTDTLTLRPLDPLLQAAGFCGLEHILWPKQRMSPWSFYYWLGGPALMFLRWVLSALPYGYRVQQTLLRWYSRAENNAVLAARPRHPALLYALRSASLLPREVWRTRFRLGTHLLQETLSQLGDSSEFERHAPGCFYPVGPVTSSHYFRRYRDVRLVCEELGVSRAFVVHWYASVSELKSLDADYVRQESDKTVFAALCNDVLSSELS
jgi:hypothetical protein